MALALAVTEVLTELVVTLFVIAVRTQSATYADGPP